MSPNSSPMIGANGSSMNACQLFWAVDEQTGSWAGPEVGFEEE
jgi:hypothetical protein